MTYLEMATTQELWDELQKRFTGCVLVYEKDTKNPDLANCNVLYNGGYCYALGLLSYANAYFASQQAKVFMNDEFD